MPTVDAVDRDRLATDHLPLVLASIRSLRRSPRWRAAYRDPDDARSDAFFALAVALDGFEPGGRWTLGVRYRRALRWVAGNALLRMRAAKRSAHRTVPLGDEDPAVAGGHDDDGPGAPMPSLAALSASQSAVIRRHLIDGDSFAEIARDRGVSKAAIHQQYSRGIAALRGRLAEPEHRTR